MTRNELESRIAALELDRDRAIERAVRAEEDGRAKDARISDLERQLAESRAHAESEGRWAAQYLRERQASDAALVEMRDFVERSTNAFAVLRDMLIAAGLDGHRVAQEFHEDAYAIVNSPASTAAAKRWSEMQTVCEAARPIAEFKSARDRAIHPKADTYALCAVDPPDGPTRTLTEGDLRRLAKAVAALDGGQQ